MRLEAESYLKSGSNEVRILEYRLGGRSFGINILKVKRIVSDLPLLTGTPNSPDHVVGVFRDREDVVPIIDLMSFLGLPDVENLQNRKVIITEFFGMLNAFSVDHIDWIHHFRWEDVIDADSVLKSLEHKYVIGIVKPEESRMIQLLDYETIILGLSPGLKVREMDKMKSLGQACSGKRILISEDSQSVRDMLAVELSEYGFEVVVAKNGEEALGHIEAGEHFDLVISDVETPQMDGLALTCAIRNRTETADLPVIIYSSIGDLGMKKRAEFLKASAHITKLNVEELLQKVTELTCVTAPEMALQES
jgi:two-component system, chemotaxis family, chemotaxis protein CheV